MEIVPSYSKLLLVVGKGRNKILTTEENHHNGQYPKWRTFPTDLFTILEPQHLRRSVNFMKFHSAMRRIFKAPNL